MRIAVVGAGAMGSIFGAALHDAQEDVVLLDVSKPLVERLEQRGVEIVRADDERTVAVRATTDPRTVGHVDVVLVFVKGYHTRDAIDFAAPLLGPDTLVASLQNGWGNGELVARAVPEDRVVIGINYHSGTSLGLGRVAHTHEGPTRLGPLIGNDVRGAEEVAQPLRRAGFELEVTADIRRQVWRKLTLNSAALPVAALTRLVSRGLADDPPFSVVEALARETVAVGVAMGFELDADKEVAQLREVLVAAGGGKASMLQDVEGHRRTEIDTINGAIARLAEQYGVSAPLNLAFADVVHGYERAHELA